MPDINTEEEYIYTSSLMHVVSKLARLSFHATMKEINTKYNGARMIESIGNTKCILRRKRSVI